MSDDDWSDLDRKCSFCEWDALYCDVLLVRGDISICLQCAQDAKHIAEKLIDTSAALIIGDWKSERAKLYPEPDGDDE